MATYKTDGIILKRTNLGEADRIVTVFSKDLGKIKFVAKGVRRTRSKLGGSIEPFCLSQLLISSGKSLDILTGAQITTNYLGLEPTLEELKTSGIMAEIIDKIIPEKIPSNSLYCLLNESFSFIKTVSTDTVRSYFEAKFLNLSGLFPETTLCIKCEDKPEGDLYFSVNGGGLLCTNCKNYFPDSKFIEVNIIKALRFTLTNDLLNFSKLNLTSNEKVELQKLLSKFTRHSLGRDLKSEAI